MQRTLPMPNLLLLSRSLSTPFLWCLRLKSGSTADPDLSRLLNGKIDWEERLIPG
jgi:hypothetical protein